jgi:hypothetical protein
MARYNLPALERSLDCQNPRAETDPSNSPVLVSILIVPEESANRGANVAVNLSVQSDPTNWQLAAAPSKRPVPPVI